MARFRFKIVDSQGRRRSGILRAESMEVAESGLKSKLCRIEELYPLPDEATPGAAPGVELARLETSFSQVDRIRRTLALLLACVCLFSFVTWVRTPAERVVAPESTEEVSFSVKGGLDTKALRTADAGFDPTLLKVYAVLPDLPYEVEGGLDESGEGFKLAVDLLGVGRPKVMAVDVALDGKRWRVADGLPVASTGDIDVGVIDVRFPSPTDSKERAVSSGAAAVVKSLDKDDKAPGLHRARTPRERIAQTRRNRRRFPK